MKTILIFTMLVSFLHVEAIGSNDGTTLTDSNSSISVTEKPAQAVQVDFSWIPFLF